MRIETGKEEIKIIKYSYKCDICGKETTSRRNCSICSKDICTDCTRYDPRDMGDYPEKYCAYCFNIGEKYLEQIRIEEESCSNRIEELEKQWRDEATEKTIIISEE